jgi:flagellar biosynthesis protein FliQ
MTPIAPTARKRFYQVGGAAAWLQLVITVVFIAAAFVLGARPTSVGEFFTLYHDDRLVALLRDDLSNVIVIALYLGTIPALYLALKQVDHATIFFAALFTLIAVTVTFATHTGFSMMHLSDRYAAAATPAEQAQILAAGEAVLASDIWNSTGGYMSGLLLQGAGVLIALVMLRSADFGKVTAYAGLLANGLDLLQHVLHPFTPSLSAIILYVAGPFYLLWFPLMGRDLLRLARRIDDAPTGEA